MTKVTLRNDIDVELIDHMGTDARVVAAAKVSTLGNAASDEHGDGLINFLMKNRHGSPFEHVLFTWRVSAPIFVWREHMRHRMTSYNEESGRYKQLEPVFYVPNADRNLIQEGKAGAYTFIPGSDLMVEDLKSRMAYAAQDAYDYYEESLAEGVAKEVARMVLPVNIYSTAYVTMNARALMNFLSLRKKSEESTYPSFPQREIEMVAEKYEDDMKRIIPRTYASFVANGRVQP